MSYRVVLERDESGAWIARVPAVRGCHSYGRTLQQARTRIREALGLWVDDADEADLRFEVSLPSRARDQVRRARTARERSDRAQHEASIAVRRAAVALTDRLGLSLRDTAELLGLSHQRVQQLLSAE
ncbi:MAG TPA: type II toxin-antitoxin system HicB family antitoxin [Actinomycetota bacterium]|nr:type II toxin-antitoxin system HicB family antitoxin [Actinomycetota bacterium]